MSSEIYFNNQKVLSAITSYNELSNASKPTIESVILEGNRTARELNLMSRNEITQLIAQSRIPAVLPNYPATPVSGVVYYIGTSAPYNVCLYAVNDVGALERVDLGTTNIDISSKQDKVDNALLTTSKNIVGAINENKTNIDLKQNKIDDTLITTNKNIVSAINEIETDINAIPDTYALKNSTSDATNRPSQADECVFNFVDNENRICRQQYFTDVKTADPITQQDVFGHIITRQSYCGSYIMIYQHFIAVYAQQKLLSKRIEFKRSGYLSQDSGYIDKNVYDNRDQITWNPWIPIEYPMVTLPTTSLNTSVVTYGNISYKIAGGVLVINFSYLKFATAGQSGQVITTNSNFSWVSHLIINCQSVIHCWKATTAPTSGFATISSSSKNITVYDVQADNKEYYGQMVVPLGY